VIFLSQTESTPKRIFFKKKALFKSKGFRQFSVGMGTKEGESHTGCVWAAGFDHDMFRSHLVSILKLMNCLIL
jgi:hypothetical protein